MQHGSDFSARQLAPAVEALSTIAEALACTLESLAQRCLDGSPGDCLCESAPNLNHKLDLIMSVISDFAAKQKAFNDRQGAAIDAAVASVNGLVGDIQTLNDKITELQNSTGGVTPEDQASIDSLVAQGSALADKAEAVQASLANLDAQTPPKIDVPPPTT